MLATTIQITNNPPHTTHTNKQQSLAGCAGNHHQQSGGRSHGVEREPDSVLVCHKSFYAQPKTRTHTHHPLLGSKHMQAQENNHAPTKPANTRLSPTKLGSLERR